MKTVKIAVCGSGLAGLTVAHLLSTLKLTDENVALEVHIFEKADEPGMDSSSHSVAFPGENGVKGEWRIDVPMRSFQGGYYPQLIRLYEYLGVKFQQADFSYSFSTLRHIPGDVAKRWSIQTKVLYNGQSGRAGLGMPSHLTTSLQGSTAMLSLLTNIGALLLLIFAYSTHIWNSVVIAFHFCRLLIFAVLFPPPPLETFRQWTVRTTPTSQLAHLVGADQSWQRFADEVLMPTFSAVCTAPVEAIWAHPAYELLEYSRLTLFTHHYYVVHNVRDVVQRLSAPVKYVHTSNPVTAIQPDVKPGKIVLICDDKSGLRRFPGFSHVIFATQANQACAILRTYLDSLPVSRNGERDAISQQVGCLSAFQYVDNIVVNHLDDSLLPDNARDRRDLDLTRLDGLTLSAPHPPGETDAAKVVTSIRKRSKAAAPVQYDMAYHLECLCPPTHTMATHTLSRPHSVPRDISIYQTTNPIVPPRKSKVLSVSHLQRAVLTVKSKVALSQLATSSPTNKPVGLFESNIVESLGPLQGAGIQRAHAIGTEAPGLWFIGAYASRGIPLLEGCVTSARRVVLEGILPCEGLVLKDDVPW